MSKIAPLPPEEPPYPEVDTSRSLRTNCLEENKLDYYVGVDFSKGGAFLWAFEGGITPDSDYAKINILTEQVLQNHIEDLEQRWKNALKIREILKGRWQET